MAELKEQEHLLVVTNLREMEESMAFMAWKNV
jgi:Lhr-like helicase